MPDLDRAACARIASCDVRNRDAQPARCRTDRVARRAARTRSQDWQRHGRHGEPGRDVVAQPLAAVATKPWRAREATRPSPRGCSVESLPATAGSCCRWLMVMEWNGMEWNGENVPRGCRTSSAARRRRRRRSDGVWSDARNVQLDAATIAAVMRNSPGRVREHATRAPPKTALAHALSADDPHYWLSFADTSSLVNCLPRDSVQLCVSATHETPVLREAARRRRCTVVVTLQRESSRVRCGARSSI